jgi:hypothetical protein
LKDLFLAMDIVAWQSQCIDIEGVGFIPNGISVKNFLNQSASFPTYSEAINFDSVVDQMIKFFLDDFQDTTPPQRIKI